MTGSTKSGEVERPNSGPGFRFAQAGLRLLDINSILNESGQCTDDEVAFAALVWSYAPAKALPAEACRCQKTTVRVLKNTTSGSLTKGLLTTGLLNDRPFDDRPGHLIRRLQQISFAIFVDQARKFDITPVQYSAIFAIGNHPGIDQTALCNIIAFDRSTIGDAVTRLEKKRLADQTASRLARHCRYQPLYITPLRPAPCSATSRRRSPRRSG